VIDSEEFYRKQSMPRNLFTKRWFDVACGEFVVVDIETTGLSAVYDRVIEVAAIKYQKGVEVDKFITLINPQVPIYNSFIHGITNEMVKGSPIIADVMPNLLGFLEDCLVVGHNVSFDLRFIEVNARGCGYTVKWDYVDTRSIAKKLLPKLYNYRQETVLDALGCKQSSWHRAESDARGCVNIFNFCLNTLKTQGIEEKIIWETYNAKPNRREKELVCYEFCSRGNYDELSDDLLVIIKKVAAKNPIEHNGYLYKKTRGGITRHLISQPNNSPSDQKQPPS
jgi:DNA polymerase III epsilon subunit family exonuclease